MPITPTTSDDELLRRMRAGDAQAFAALQFARHRRRRRAGSVHGQVTVYSKHSDPRSGDYVYRLEGLKRGEPDAALFTVPSDYQVKERGRRAPE